MAKQREHGGVSERKLFTLVSSIKKGAKQPLIRKPITELA